MHHTSFCPDHTPVTEVTQLLSAVVPTPTPGQCLFTSQQDFQPQLVFLCNIWLRGYRSTLQGSATAKSLQSCPTLCNPIDGSPAGSPIPGILQARTLEWVALSFSNAWKWKVKRKSLSHVWPSATPWTAAFQAPPSMGFSRQIKQMGIIFILKLD